MVKKQEVHDAHLQVVGHLPNWVIQFICSCGQEIGVAATFTVDELKHLLSGHVSKGEENAEDNIGVSEDKTDS